MNALPVPATETPAAFARRLGCARSYITQLKHDGRLVLSADGKVIQVAESIARIAATKDPSRAARARQPEEPAQPPAGQGTSTDDEAGTSDFQSARARTEHYKSLQAKADYEKSIGVLVESDAVRNATAEVGQAVRRALERIPDDLAPLLVGIEDETRIRTLLAEHVESALENLSAGLTNLLKDPAA